MAKRSETKGGGPKTDSGKEKSLANLRRGGKPGPGEFPDEIDNKYIDHFKYVKSMLSLDDFRFYTARWNAHIKEYVDLDAASDIDDLHAMLMELIIQKNLMQDKKKDSSISITKEYDASIARYNALKKSLATSRDKRISTGKKDDISSLAALILDFTEERKAELEAREEELKQEESGERKAKQKRDTNILAESGLDKILAGKGTSNESSE